MSKSEAFERGLAMRKAVVGEARVSASLERADDFARPIQDAVTAFAFGDVWSRPGLDPRARSVATITLLIAQRSRDELKVHICGGIRNGLTAVEVRELILHVAVYAGFPAALAAVDVAREALAEMGIACTDPD